MNNARVSDLRPTLLTSLNPSPTPHRSSNYTRRPSKQPSISLSSLPSPRTGRAWSPTRPWSPKRPWTFWSIVVLVILLVFATVGAAIAGNLAARKGGCVCGGEGEGDMGGGGDGQGRMMAVEERDVPWANTIHSVRVPPERNASYTSAPHGVSFETLFNIDIGGPSRAAFVASTLEICLEACANTNELLGEAACKAAVWVPAWTNGQSDGNVTGGLRAANCWLKGEGEERVVAGEERRPMWAGVLL